MAPTSRRTFLVGSAALPVAAAAIARISPDLQTKVAADLDKYIGFGSKQAGGAGDNACGAWLAAEIESLGFKVERQEFSTPFFEPTRSELLCGDTKAPLWPQPIVVQTGADGVTGPLV